MQKFKEWFKRTIKSKTFWVSLSGICATISTMVIGELSIAQGIVIIFGMLIAIAFRDTVAKNIK